MSYKKSKERVQKRLDRIRVSLGIKAALAVTLISFLLSTLALVLSVRRFSQDDLAHWLIDGYRLARSVAVLVDQDVALYAFGLVKEGYEKASDELLENQTCDEYRAFFAELDSNEDYQEMRRSLQKITNENDIELLSLNILDEENMRNIYVLDTEDREDMKYIPGFWRTMEDSEYNVYEYCRQGAVLFDTVYDVAYSKDGMFRVAAPFYHPDTNEVLGYVTIYERWDEISQSRHEFVINVALSLFAATAFFVILSIYLMKRVIINPINSLSSAADAYSKSEIKDGSADFFSDLDIHSGDELEILCDSMRYMERSLNEYVVNLKDVTAEQEHTRTELDVAAKIQKDMLPNHLKGYDTGLGLQIRHYMKPARQVGGDFYDFFRVDDEHVAVVIGDVSGKGIPSAFFMVVARTLLKNSILDGGELPQIAQSVNQQLYENNPESLFVTVWMGIYSIKTGHFNCVNAGHDSPIVYRNAEGRFAALDQAHDLPFGIFDEGVYQEQEFDLEPGDRVFLYTDGITEATAASDELYGKERLIACLDAHASMDDGDELIQEICEDIRVFVAGAPQFDDMTMVLFSLEAADGEQNRS